MGTTMIGHNKGPILEPGTSYKHFLWSKARRDLLPVLPLPVVKMRVRRAAEIGLDYKTYATVRATTGRDVVALLFSTNALRLFKAQQALDAERSAKLRAIQACDRGALAIRPLIPKDLGCPEIDAAFPAPEPFATWRRCAEAVVAARAGKPADAVLLIGDTALERGWSAAGRLAGYVPAERYFR